MSTGPSGKGRHLAVRSILEAEARGRVLRLEAPLSFWGGVDPESGRIIDRQHPQQGERLAGRVLVLPGLRGSTAGPGALLELLAGDCAPAAMLFERIETAPLVAVLTGGLIDLAWLPLGVFETGEAAQAPPVDGEVEIVAGRWIHHSG